MQPPVTIGLDIAKSAFQVAVSARRVMSSSGSV